MLIPFAMRKSDGLLVDASDVPRGKACNCICPVCKRDLVAKHCSRRVDHFAHLADVDCSITYETAVHLAAKQAIKEIGFIILPPISYQSTLTGRAFEKSGGEFRFNKIDVEAFLTTIKPDLILYSKQETPLAVEITYRHPTEEEKIRHYEKLKVSCLEIDLSELPLNTQYEKIKEILSDGKARQNWLYNKKFAQFKKDDKQLSDKLAEENRNRIMRIRRDLRKGAEKIRVHWHKTRYNSHLIPHTAICPLKKRSYRKSFFANVELDCKQCQCFFGKFSQNKKYYETVLCGGNVIIKAEIGSEIAQLKSTIPEDESENSQLKLFNDK